MYIYRVVRSRRVRPRSHGCGSRRFTMPTARPDARHLQAQAPPPALLTTPSLRTLALPTPSPSCPPCSVLTTMPTPTLPIRPSLSSPTRTSPALGKTTPRGRNPRCPSARGYDFSLPARGSVSSPSVLPSSSIPSASTSTPPHPRASRALRLYARLRHEDYAPGRVGSAKRYSPIKGLFLFGLTLTTVSTVSATSRPRARGGEPHARPAAPLAAAGAFPQGAGGEGQECEDRDEDAQIDEEDGTICRGMRGRAHTLVWAGIRICSIQLPDSLPAPVCGRCGARKGTGEGAGDAAAGFVTAAARPTFVVDERAGLTPVDRRFRVRDACRGEGREASYGFVGAREGEREREER
ncbi:hypothetical protein DFH06DRAFT_1300850 [Mycena polygramma]|nr:hypothetical protein DFH06DRAFT_1300850 [Mycena polygramma]